MTKEFLTDVGNNMSGMDRLEFMNDYIKGMWPDSSMTPLCDLVSFYQEHPNLVAPVILAGVGVKIEDGQILIYNPEALERIFAISEDAPLSDELREETTELLVLAMDRLIDQWQKTEDLSLRFTDDVHEELLVGNYAAILAKERPGTRKLIGKYAQSVLLGNQTYISLDQLLARFRGENIEEQNKTENKFPEPNQERLQEIKDICQKMGFSVLKLRDEISGIDIEFGQNIDLGKQEDQESVARLVKMVAYDFGIFYQWKTQRKLTIITDDDNVEYHLIEDSANATFSTIKRDYFGRPVIKILGSNYKRQGMKVGTIYNPVLNIGSMEGRDEDYQLNLAKEYLQRYGELEEVQRFIGKELRVVLTQND